MDGPFGWTGRVLQIDLSEGSSSIIPTKEFEPEKYLGGVGLNTRIFWALDCPSVRALDPLSPLMIASGPLAGLPGPFGRGHICGIAPQSYPDEVFSYSGFGGKWPSELKYAGFDGLILQGKADGPVFVAIEDQDVLVRPAADLWGLGTLDTQRVLAQRFPAASVLCIGPAGEALSRNAVVATETGNAAGQGGFGAVLGSKNLKAIAVRGTGTVRIRRPDEFGRLLADRKAAGDWLQGRQDLRQPIFGGAVTTAMVQKYRRKPGGCYACPHQCTSFYDVPGHGRGVATCASWWYSFFRESPRAAWEAQHLAQAMGVNHYDLFGLMFFLAGLAEQRMLAPADWRSAGLPELPEFLGGRSSDERFIRDLIQGIADGSSPLSAGIARALDGIIRAMGDPPGIRQVFEKIFPAFGYTIHYLGWIGFALHWALDVRDPGGDADEYHDFAYCAPWLREGIRPGSLASHFGMPAGETTFAHPKGGSEEANYGGIEQLTWWVQKSQSLKNSLPMCAFQALPSMYFHPPEMDFRLFESRVLSAVTGVDVDPDELWRTGERIWTLRRAVMIMREKRSRAQDTFHSVVFDTRWGERDVHLDGTTAVAQFDRSEFESLKDRYYTLCGWDPSSGRPTRACLERLDMGNIAEDLAREDLLGSPAACSVDCP